MTATAAEFRDLLRIPYRFNSVDPARGLDCRGLALEITRRRGLPCEDPWTRVLRLWREGRAWPDGAWGDGWARADPPLRDDDIVLIAGGREQGVGYVLFGMVWSTSPLTGVTSVPVDRWVGRVSQVWRYQR